MRRMRHRCIAKLPDGGRRQPVESHTHAELLSFPPCGQAQSPFPRTCKLTYSRHFPTGVECLARGLKRKSRTQTAVLASPLPFPGNATPSVPADAFPRQCLATVGRPSLHEKRRKFHPAPPKTSAPCRSQPPSRSIPQVPSLRDRYG